MNKKTFKKFTIKTFTLATLAMAFGTTVITANAFDTDEVKTSQTPLAGEFSKLDANSNGTLTRLEAKKDVLKANRIVNYFKSQ